MFLITNTYQDLEKFVKIKNEKNEVFPFKK